MRTLDFAVSANHRYTVDILHENQQAQPEALQVFDTTSGAVISRAPCDLVYEAAPPFSNLSVPPEQCAVHILSDEDNLLFSFYVNGSHEYRAGTSVGSTLFLVPGPQLIEVGLRSKRKLLGGLRSKKTDALTVACAAGATTFVQVEFPGFFAPKATLTELSAEEAQPIISRITSNSN